MNMKTIFIPVLLLPSMFVQAATQQQIEQAQVTGDQVLHQQQVNMQQQQDKLTPLQPPSGVNLQSDLQLTEGLVEANGNCIELEYLKVDGASLLDEWELEVLEVPFVGKCINSDLVASVLATTTDFYIKRGYVTTRAYLPKQNLRQGVLRIEIAEGKFGEVFAKGNDDGMNLAATLPVDDQEPMHIRDLEQAVDQLNAVPGNNVTMEIVPGATEDTSDVVFTNHGDGKPTGSLTLNDGGSDSTGKYSLSAAFAAGDLLNLSDVWSLTASESYGSDTGASNSLSLNVKIPHGYNTYTIGASDTDYETLLVFPSTGTSLTSSGATQGFTATADRLIYRDQDTKHNIGTTISHSATQSYIGGQLIDVNSRTTNSLQFYGRSSLGFDDKMLIISPQIEVGLSEVDNLPAGTNTPVQNPQAEYIRYQLRFDWSQPLNFAGQAWQWKSAFNYQYSPDILYGSQQISIGGLGSVRGFKNVSLAGDSGYFWQNSLVLNQEVAFGELSGAMQYTLGYDFGEVTSSSSDDYVGGMQGMFVEASLHLQDWRLGVSWSNPLSVNTELDKGDSSILATISLDL